MKTYAQILRDDLRMIDYEFIAGQFMNDTASSDEDMIDNFEVQTGLDKKVIKKIVKGARPKVKPGSTEKAINIIKKFA